MRLYTNKDNRITADTCKGINSSDLSEYGFIYIDDSKVTVFYTTVDATFFYFKVDSQWYKVKRLDKLDNEQSFLRMVDSGMSFTSNRSFDIKSEWV